MASPLIAFPDATTRTPAIEIHVTATLHATELQFNYELQGDLRQIALPSPSPAPERRDNLWKKTCFEAFWQEKGASTYWELNLSPSGDWNLYLFSGYRQGMVREERMTRLPFQLERGEDRLRLSCSVPMGGLGIRFPIRIGCTAIIEDMRGALSYWALKHAGAQPDFHRQDGFILEINASEPVSMKV